MGLFICSKCNCVDNTAMGEYWSRPENPLCCECSELKPSLGFLAPYGKWHDIFPKKEYDPLEDKDFVMNPPKEK